MLRNFYVQGFHCKLELCTPSTCYIFPKFMLAPTITYYNILYFMPNTDQEFALCHVTATCFLNSQQSLISPRFQLACAQLHNCTCGLTQDYATLKPDFLTFSIIVQYTLYKSSNFSFNANWICSFFIAFHHISEWEGPKIITNHTRSKNPRWSETEVGSPSSEESVKVQEDFLVTRLMHLPLNINAAEHWLWQTGGIICNNLESFKYK